MASNTSAADYKYQFVSEPDDALKCLICLEVAEEPWQHGECGKLFCETCLDKLGRDKPCPVCRREQPQYLRDGKSKREIKVLNVKCGNVQRKCEWVGTVGTLEEHVATCEFALLPCPKECKSDDNKVKYFMRKDLDEHIKKDCPNRDHICGYCGEKGTYASITQIHDKTCQMKVVPCPNDGCTDTMPRQHVEKHVATECGFTVIPCKYRRLGCDAELQRKDTAAHEEDDKLHLRMAIDMADKLETELKRASGQVLKLERTTVQLETDLERALETNEKLEKDLELVAEIATVGIFPAARNKIKVINFKLTKYEGKKYKVQSPSYYISTNGYRMAIEVYANGNGTGEGTHVSVYARILKGRYDAELKWPFVGTITFTLLNQLEDRNHHQDTLHVKPSCNAQAEGPKCGYDQFIHHSTLPLRYQSLYKRPIHARRRYKARSHYYYTQYSYTQYLKDDTLYFRMSVEEASYDHKPWLE